ncbi:unnamed protein product [Discosporangium mesarthrocarpum]
MKTVGLVAFLGGLVLPGSLAEDTTSSNGFSNLLHPRSYYEEKFYDWMAKYGIQFESGKDFVRRLEIFARSDDKIATHNSEGLGYTLGHNAYSHMTWEEFREHFSIGKTMLLERKSSPPEDYPVFDVGPVVERKLRGLTLPDEVDWVSKGAVTAVKNQGSCGSCWSFSTTGAMEGAHFIKTGELVMLSEQELVDCDTYDEGCNGGLMDYSFHWIQQNRGICSEEDYPYTAASGFCMKSSCKTVPGTDIAKWVDVEPTEEALMEAVTKQPVSVAIEADQMSFQLYSKGVMSSTCGTNLDHGVLLTGYGTSEDGDKFWKVKNSWGGDWGMGGYILLSREVDQEGGQCGILMQPSYPVLA